MAMRDFLGVSNAAAFYTEIAGTDFTVRLSSPRCMPRKSLVQGQPREKADSKIVHSVFTPAWAQRRQGPQDPALGPQALYSVPARQPDDPLH